MFLQFYGLNEQPFGVTPDPKYLYLSPSHREALASLHVAIQSNRGFTALIAEPGMGKTTILFDLLNRLRQTSRTVFLFQTMCTPREFLDYLLADLGCDCTGLDLVSLHAQLNEILIKEAHEGRSLVVIIDEAQNLDDSVLETIRLLSDFETPGRKLMHIVLSGQPQLAEKLSRPNLAQLRQRISITSRLERLSASEVKEYIEYRLKVAGYKGGTLFAPAALELITRYSEGNPRTINNICFNALTLGYANQKKKIGRSIIREAASDLALRVPSRLGALAVKSASIASIIIATSLAFSSSRMLPPNPIPAVWHAPLIEAPLSTAILKPIPPPGPMTVTVQQGDTLRQICLRHLQREPDAELVGQIMKLNPGMVSKDIIRIGEPLRLPIAVDPSTGSTP
jgi:general secretion pathway protein A